MAGRVAVFTRAECYRAGGTRAGMVDDRNASSAAITSAAFANIDVSRTTACASSCSCPAPGSESKHEVTPFPTAREARNRHFERRSRPTVDERRVSSSGMTIKRAWLSIFAR